MPQPTKASSTPQTVAGIKARNEGGRAPPSTSRPVKPMPIAIEGEGGFAYLNKMLARGGPAGTGETFSHVTNAHPQIPVDLFPICPSLASEIQQHVSILFAIQVAKYYSDYQGQFPAAANAPATEVMGA